MVMTSGFNASTWSSVGGGADDLDIRIRGKDFRDAPTKEAGIVDDQDLDCHTSLLAAALPSEVSAA